MIEVEVHSSLRAFLREQGQPSWPHHLTMARLVARALRLGRPALIQTGSTQARYRLSYLAPALIWDGPVILVAPVSVQQWLLRVEIPRLQQWIGTDKPIQTGDKFPDERFDGLLITSPASWLADRLEDKTCFPNGVPTLIDGADDLEGWVREQLQGCLQPWDWDELMLARPHQADWIRDVRVRLTKAIFQHPPNPYNCCLIDVPEQETLRQLFEVLQSSVKDQYRYLPTSWRYFWHCWQRSDQLIWATIARSQGHFCLYCEPLEVAGVLSQIWSQQPVVLVGEALDLEASASVYRQQLGLGEVTCLKFSPDRQSELIQLYLPDGLPMPNTPRFQDALIQQVRTLLILSASMKGPVVFLVGDIPLKAQVGAVLAAEFGSRVQVEKTDLNESSILVCGWEFWRSHQTFLPPPQLLIIATLPIPSLENPVVAGQVAYYKKQRLDWFRLYLLPAALRELQRAIAPVRESQGVVALLDNRVNHRSYGRQVLSALSPFARINYLDASWFD
ncbi:MULTISPECIES: helicase C-terminal domain-containing protein [unclassified Coleofasciculus]|uniref:helicase C-terminal domain-containing protein n=1 Tax=unclassified Coleofasciculus TaxID=2692782 RepID=UPI00188221DB|nr:MULTISPECIES: helicase C-terminal domain-containing protein [unclassified Coleofasciculus]MBE9127572.1 ATP-dependent DNA helicase [Coleofasciculus sp. LEGE 07081]MBE9147184.1 ATP-dependent DNA helicase [Coleofasciculus sp. LEGE 07092]